MQNLRSLGTGRLALLAGVGGALVLALMFGLNAVMTPPYRTLYSGLDATSSASMVSALEQAGYSVKISDDGSVVSVPEGDLARARMTVAEQGLTGKGAPGWELFDESSGLGMNSFLQQVNRLRAMEGELARSIQTLDGVEAARVHLVLPEREAFSRDRPEPSASVIIRTAPGRDMGRRQALAIRNLVASAVPNLSSRRVTVLSAAGEVILADDIEDSVEAGLSSARTALEDRMARNIEQILTARVGAGNARVQVSVELSSERQVVVQQSYDPDQQVVRSTTTAEDAARGQDGGQDAVGVQGNLPPALGGGNQPAASSNSRNRNEENVAYEIGNTRTETVTEAGQVQKVSVAVLVNGIYDVQPNGEQQYQERSPEELERLSQLVRSAVGYDQARGDTVSVDSLRFMDYSMGLGEPARVSLGQQLIASLPSILRWLFALAVVGVVLFFGVRPALNRLAPPAKEEEEDALGGFGGFQMAMAPNMLEEIGGGPALLGGGGDGGFGMMGGEEGGVTRFDPNSLMGSDDEEIPIMSVQGTILKRHIEALGRLVEDEPEAALRVLRGWMAQGG